MTNGPQAPSRTILHVDMDAFYASVELLRRPELRGLPVVVGGAGRRGVIAAASYEARSYGVRSAMASSEAMRRCPDAVFLPGDHHHYREISRQIMAIMARFTPLIEPLSLDEAFLDVSSGRRLFGDGERIARELRSTIHAETQLWCSAGVAANKFLAKLASEQAKPKPSRRGPIPGAGVFVVPEGGEIDFLHPLPARALWGVGPATMTKLERLGIATVGDIAAVPLETLQATVGKASGRHLHALSHARDDRDVEPDQRPKSISHEETFEYDRHDIVELHRDLLRMADAVCARLRKADLVARTVSIKVRFGDFTTLTRSQTLASPTDSGSVVNEVARELLAKVDTGRGVRLLGVGTAGLGQEEPHQLTFDDALAADEPVSRDRRRADQAVDEIRQRYGVEAIGPAALVEPGEGLQTRERSEKPWG